MSETLSTRDNPVQWMDNVSQRQERNDTLHFLFAQNDGHLLVREPVAEHFALRMTFSSMAAKPSTAQRTMDTRQMVTPIPRAQRVNTRPKERSILIKKYEGVVVFRDGQRFVARLFENASDYPVVEAEFDLEELSESDRDLAVEGAPLVWTIYIAGGSGIDELWAVLAELKNRQMATRYPTPKLASANKILWECAGNPSATVKALSPSDAGVVAAIANLGVLTPKLSKTRRRLPSLKQNDASVVLSVRVGDHRVLLGADLQVTVN